ncbi:FAD-binding oxidoreductase [Desulfatibacillum aliphaticivorans]|uniref:FAD-binding oxidoreductase n=1 Tax=Desulfatibacillum aliphaticivorans TaxID=218208 RepID=UPI0004275D1C|nr:FAD-binding protein [Desulfatibacillum aliphaticivorans]
MDKECIAAAPGFSGGVEDDPQVLSNYSVNNPLLEECAPSAGVVRPKDVSSLQALLKTQKIQMAPVSSIGPHIRGGIQRKEPHVAMDLSHWNEILWINRRNRVCIVQPGVTYGQLQEALKPHGMTLPTPLAPRSGKSVLAAVLDREPSTWPNKQWDYQDPVASTEIVFGNGRLFRTGAAGGPGSLEAQRKSKGAQKSPLGPGQSDFQRVVMGGQGRFGVATWISLRTELAPSVQESYFLGGDLDSLIPYVYAVQRPWLGEHAFLLNRTAAAMLMSHDASDDFDQIRKGLPEFVCLQNIAGFERLPKERLEYQKADIWDMARQNSLALEEGLGDVSATDFFQTSTSVCGPQDWRHGLKGHCLSVIFLSTLDQAPKFLEVFHEALDRAGVNRDSGGLYIQPVVQNHACHFELMLPFNPADAKEVSVMKSLEQDLCRRLFNAGAYFSRPYGAARAFATGVNSGQDKLIDLAQDLFDPEGLLGFWNKET